ncbi:MAG: corrinoid protein [Anaerolineae bacterium]
MSKEDVLARMGQTIEAYDKEGAVAAAQAALEAGIDPVEALEEGFAKPLRVMGERFDRMEIFLPQLVMAADAMKEGVRVLEKVLLKRGERLNPRGVAVIGTVEGDIHDIGKTIVIAMLQSAGFEVHDLGKDVPITRFLQAAEEVGANIIGVSALLSTTMLRQRDLIELMERSGVRDKYFVIVGGAPVTAKWAEEIGADAYARNAIEAVRVVEGSLN